MAVRMEDYMYAKINLKNLGLIFKKAPFPCSSFNFHLFIFLLQATFWNQIDPVLRDCQFENHFVIVNTSTCCPLLTEYVKSLADFVKYGGHFLL